MAQRPESSMVKNWTDLPKDIEPDFISFSGDYDHPNYLSTKEEWLHLSGKKRPKHNVILSEPFLIGEMNRFVPFLERDDTVKFHPLNMPYVKLGKIEFMGVVTKISENPRYYEYQVDDGTGVITVNYEKSHLARQIYERKAIDEKYAGYAKMQDRKGIKGIEMKDCPKKFPDPRPGFEYSEGTNIQDMAILEDQWSRETKGGTLGKQVELYSYLHVEGYCTLDFMFTGRAKKEITFEKLSAAKLTFLATKVYNVNEFEYNKKQLFWLSKVIPRRYEENPNAPKCTLKRPEETRNIQELKRSLRNSPR